MGLYYERHAPAALPRETPGTHCRGGWVDLLIVLEVCGKFRPHRGSITVPSSRYRVNIPTELYRLPFSYYTYLVWFVIAFKIIGNSKE